MSVLSGISRAAKMGIFIRNGDALQVSSKISHVVFDKTEPSRSSSLLLNLKFTPQNTIIMKLLN